MSMKILPSAMEDLRRGWQFYEWQQKGLGEYFLDSLFSDIESLKLYPGVHRIVFGYHRLLSKRFPFAIYYEFDGADQILIFRILDMRQDPSSIVGELK